MAGLARDWCFTTIHRTLLIEYRFFNLCALALGNKLTEVSRYSFVCSFLFVKAQVKWMKLLTGVRILCVDDSADSLELLRHVLVRYGASVTTCISAEAAIEILKKSSFDVMVSDLSMPPGLDGYDLVHALRDMEKQDPDRKATPTVAVSGDAMRASRKRRFADFQVYMPKPANKKRLVYVVERLFEADGEAIEFGSLASWEAEQASQAAAVATKVAATATAVAAEATTAAANATVAAVDASQAAVDAKAAALAAEKVATSASSEAPRHP